MHDGQPWGVAVSAARLHPDDVELIADAVARKLREPRRDRKKRAAPIVVSDTDRAAAHAAARRLGLRVKDDR